jgi:hypothetical protein
MSAFDDEHKDTLDGSPKEVREFLSNVFSKLRETHFVSQPLGNDNSASTSTGEKRSCPDDVQADSCDQHEPKKPKENDDVVDVTDEPNVDVVATEASDESSSTVPKSEEDSDATSEKLENNDTMGTKTESEVFAQ